MQARLRSTACMLKIGREGTMLITVSMCTSQGRKGTESSNIEFSEKIEN